jgi:sec-independent protein translocase protein TatA
MFELPGGIEWIVILAIVLLVFGVGRVGRIGGELGKGIREFRKGLEGDEEPEAYHDEPKPPASG